MYLRVNLLGPGPRFMKKRIYRAAVLHRLRKHCSTNTSHGNTVFAASGCELSSSTISKRRDVRVWLHPSETPNQIEMNSQFHPPPPPLPAAPSMEQSPGRVSQVVVPTLTELSPLIKKNPLPAVVFCARQTHVTSHTYFYKAYFNIIPHTSIPRFVK